MFTEAHEIQSCLYKFEVLYAVCIQLSCMPSQEGNDENESVMKVATAYSTLTHSILQL